MVKKTPTEKEQSKTTVSPSELLQIIDYICSPYDKADRKFKKSAAVMIWGKPGIGKTDIVKTYAAARGRRLVASI